MQAEVLPKSAMSYLIHIWVTCAQQQAGMTMTDSLSMQQAWI